MQQQLNYGYFILCVTLLALKLVKYRYTSGYVLVSVPLLHHGFHLLLFASWQCKLILLALCMCVCVCVCMSVQWDHA